MEGVNALVGRWLASKARRQQRESGTAQAAANLRKQGVPMPLAMLILAQKRRAS